MRSSWTDAGSPAVPAAFGAGLGVLLGVLLPVPSPPWLAVALGLLGAGLALLGDRRLVPFGLLVAFAVAGGQAGRSRLHVPARAAELATRDLPEGAVIEATGRLTSFWSATGSLRRIELTPESVTRDGRPLPITRPLSFVVAGERDPRAVADAGDRVRVRGPLRLPDLPRTSREPFRLPPQPYLTLKSAAQIDRLEGPSGVGGAVQRLHRAVRGRLERNAGEAGREALPLVLALLFGETSELPVGTAAAFRDGGVAHVLSISGLHIGLVAVAVSWLLRRTPLDVRARDVTILVLVAAYALFAGGRPPVARAALMIGLYLLARLLGRPTSPGQVVGFAAAALLLWEPANLFDIGFQLTFAAVLGLSAFGVPAIAALEERGVPPLLATSFGGTAGAELAVFPVQCFVFNVVPFVSVVSNLIVVPLASLLMLAALAAQPLLLATPGTAALAWAPLSFLASAIVRLLELLDRLAAFRLVPTPPFWLVALLGALLAAGALRRARPLLVPALALVAAILLRPAAVAEAGTARLQGIDVGQGDAWLLVSEHGRVLVDGGGSIDPELDFGRSRLLPKLADLGAVALDAVVLTHPHPDHARGLLSTLALVPVRQLVVPRGAPRNAFLDEVLAASRRRGVPVVRLGAGESLAAGGFDLRALHPGPETYARSKENNGSLVLSTRLGTRTVLLTGDVEAPAERDLVARGASLRADVLKVAHHGSRTSTTPAFLAAVAPRVTLVGVGRRNRFGHPSPEVLERLSGTLLLRTDRDGDFTLVSRGGHLFPERRP